MLHQRKVYDLLDLIGDLGGVFEICFQMLGFFILPVSYHSFIIKALKKIFLIKSKDDELTGPTDNKVGPAQRVFSNQGDMLTFPYKKAMLSNK